MKIVMLIGLYIHFNIFFLCPRLFPIGLFWKMVDRGQPICLIVRYRISSLQSGQVER